MIVILGSEHTIVENESTVFSFYADNYTENRMKQRYN